MYFFCILLACGAIIHGPIINNQESDRPVEVLMGNEDSPIELICQANISNRSGPTIALVSPEVIENNGFKDLRRGDSNDDLYLKINYTQPEHYPQTNTNIMRYSLQLYPKLKMNLTTLRCGVVLLQQNSRICWGEQIVRVHYNGLSTPSPACMCTTPDTNGTTESSASVSVGGQSSSKQRDGIIAGAVLGFIAIVAVVVVLIFLVVFRKMWRRREPVNPV